MSALNPRVIALVGALESPPEVISAEAEKFRTVFTALAKILVGGSVDVPGVPGKPDAKGVIGSPDFSKAREVALPSDYFKQLRLLQFIQSAGAWAGYTADHRCLKYLLPMAQNALAAMDASKAVPQRFFGLEVSSAAPASDPDPVGTAAPSAAAPDSASGPVLGFLPTGPDGWMNYSW